MQDYRYRSIFPALVVRFIYEGLISPVVLHVRNVNKFKRTTKRTYEQ